MGAKVEIDVKILRPLLDIGIEDSNGKILAVCISDDVTISTYRFKMKGNICSIMYKISDYLREIENIVENYKSKIKNIEELITNCYNVEFKEKWRGDCVGLITLEDGKFDYKIIIHSHNIKDTEIVVDTNTCVNRHDIKKSIKEFHNIFKEVEKIFEEYIQMKSEFYKITKEFLKEINMDDLKIHIS